MLGAEAHGPAQPDDRPEMVAEERAELSGVHAVPQSAHPEDAIHGQQQAQQQQGRTEVPTC